MFNLTAAELDNAFRAISHHGYSTMLPEPPEWKVIAENWQTVRDALEKLDLDTYEPMKVMKVFAPKNRANVRITHMLHPQDLIIYTALVLIAKNDIEAARVPVKSKRVFSYRCIPNADDRLYDSRGSHEAYKDQLDRKSNKAQVRFVAIADIADFFPRVNQHRLENVIQTVAKSQRVTDVARVLVKKLISNLMGRDSFGIPVGPYASRILAEASMIDVDEFLLTQGVDFVRWVDDYNIFCKTEYEAQSVLFGLGEWLFTKHGLTLQSAKTKILPVNRYRAEILLRHEENLTDRDTVVSMFRGFRTGYDDSHDVDDPDEAEIQQALAILQGYDLKGMLEASLADTALVDYEAVSYALTKLPRIPGAEDSLKRDVLELVIDNAELLYPVAEQIAKYVLSFDDFTSADRKRIATKLLRPIKSQRNSPPPYYAMWILHVFASSSAWNHASDILAVYNRATSEVIKRHAAFVIHSSGNRAQAVAIKDEFGGASPLLKLAILFASRKLGHDERKHWRLANGVSGAIEKLI